ncbi:hypothetical protein RAS1_35860 [Phycisphaerae bacterium RAS1]|nr:hypothetical protein RAS1_35860 [Phycisphaerae bacterium RAS1]
MSNQVVNVRAIQSLVERDRRSTQSWFARPAVIFLFGLGLLIMVGAGENLLAAALAYVNLIIMAATAVHFAKQRTLHGAIPIFFLAWFAMSWPFTSIYAAVFNPHMAYSTLHDVREFLSGNVRLQLVVLLFLAVYIPIVTSLIRPAAAGWTDQYLASQHARRLALVALVITIVFLGANAFSKVRPLPGPLQYIADGSYLYLRGLVFVIGATFPFLVFGVRATAIAYLLLSGFFYTLGNAREFAVLPLGMLLGGLLFVSRLSKRWKLIVVTGVALAFPVYLVVGETTRAMLGTVGFKNLERRAETLGRWQEMFSKGGGVTRAFGRLFNTGGHSLITLMPESYPYLEFSAPRYVVETVQRLVPGRIFYQPYYSSAGLLRSYDFNITDKTSVELSFLGSLWMIGGPVPVIVGTVVIALIHAGLARLLLLLVTRSPGYALLMAAMLAPEIMWAVNSDIITNIRNIVWRLLAATVVYFVVFRPFIGRDPQAAHARHPAVATAPTTFGEHRRLAGAPQ